MPKKFTIKEIEHILWNAWIPIEDKSDVIQGIVEDFEQESKEAKLCLK